MLRWGMLTNYGSLPQTFSSPFVYFKNMYNKIGDADPLDIIDVSKHIIYSPGDIVEAKVSLSFKPLIY